MTTAPPLYTYIKNVRRLVIHHSATPRSQTTESIRHFHTRPKPEGNGWSDIGYHYVIEEDGSLHVGRPFPRMGAHASPINYESMGVCVVGDNTIKSEQWNHEQHDALRRFVSAVRLLWPKIEVVGHREVDSTLCPGLKPNELRELLGSSLSEGGDV